MPLGARRFTVLARWRRKVALWLSWGLPALALMALFYIVSSFMLSHSVLRVVFYLLMTLIVGAALVLAVILGFIIVALRNLWHSLTRRREPARPHVD